MAIVQAVRSSLGAKVALKLAVVVLVLTVVAAAVITLHQTRQLESLTLEKARLVATAGARHYGEALDSAIDAGILTVNDAFERNYVEIKGYDWGKKPKFHTKFDAITDRAVTVFQDRLLDYEDFTYAVGVDDNGYVPTHNTKYQLPVTGIPEKDLAGNRTKGMYNDTVGLAAARNLEPSLQQIYKRDTGEVMWDVSSPVMVKGKHWGAFRVGVSMERIATAQRSLLFTLAGIFLLFLLVTVGTTYFVLRASMVPVVQLTAAADQISLGEALDTAIKSRSPDEIGRLTKSVDRLRVSMKAALSRLGQQ